MTSHDSVAREGDRVVESCDGEGIGVQDRQRDVLGGQGGRAMLWL